MVGVVCHIMIIEQVCLVSEPLIQFCGLRIDNEVNSKRGRVKIVDSKNIPSLSGYVADHVFVAHASTPKWKVRSVIINFLDLVVHKLSILEIIAITTWENDCVDSAQLIEGDILVFTIDERNDSGSHSLDPIHVALHDIGGIVIESLVILHLCF
jgi:hypothetical protein